MVIRHRPNDSSSSVDNDDEGVEDARNEPPMQTPPQHRIIEVETCMLIGVM